MIKHLMKLVSNAIAKYQSNIYLHQELTLINHFISVQENFSFSKLENYVSEKLRADSIYFSDIELKSALEYVLDIIKKEHIKQFNMQTKFDRCFEMYIMNKEVISYLPIYNADEHNNGLSIITNDGYEIHITSKKSVIYSPDKKELASMEMLNS